MAMTMVAPAAGAGWRRDAPPRVRLGERHGHREEPPALRSIDRAVGRLGRLRHGARHLEREPALGAAEVVQGHGARSSDPRVMAPSYSSRDEAPPARVVLLSP